MKKKYRIYRDPNETWWVDSILPGLDTLWVSDYRIYSVFARPVFDRLSGDVVRGPIDHYKIERWDHEHNAWSLMSRAKTWLDAIKLVAYRERQLQSSEDRVHHLEPCS